MPDDPVMVSINSQTGLHPDEIARRTFPSARRGVDGDAVRRFLEAVAAELQEVLDREQVLRRRLAEAERRAAEPELDEETLMQAVGAETARILQTAHAAAGDVVSKAEVRASEILSAAENVLAERTSVAEEEAAAILQAAQAEVRALLDAAESQAKSLRDEAVTETEALTGRARAEAIALLDATRSECRRIVRESRELRQTVLGDLAERHRGLRIQLEQLQAGRDSLVDVVDAVGAAVDHVRDRLANAEHEARLAAAEAGERAATEEDEAGEELFATEVDIAVDLEGDLEEVLEGGEGREGGKEGVRVLHLEEVALLVDEGLAGELGPELYDNEALGEEPAEEVEPAGGDGAQSSHRSVDELFARIRASRGDAEAEAAEAASEGVLGQHSAHEAAVLESDEDIVGEEEAGNREDVAGETAIEVVPRAVAEPAASDAEQAAQPAQADAGPEEGDAGEEEAAAAEESADSKALARRAERLDPSASKLTRSLKRVLQDDQNLLLDSLRHATGTPDLDRLLPEDEQRTRLANASAKLLADAWTVGYGWLADKSPSHAEASEAGLRLAGQLAVDVTSLLRHRLREALSSITDIAEGGADAAGAAYREWRGARVEGTAGDFAARAFSDGAVSGGEGVLVHWVVDDTGGPCPDCDDNALAGDVAAGEEFPTGQRHPPVHPGCRCLLVPISS